MSYQDGDVADEFLRVAGVLRIGDIMSAIEEKLASEDGKCEMCFTRFIDPRDGSVAYRFRASSTRGSVEAVSGSPEGAAQRCLLLLTAREERLNIV